MEQNLRNLTKHLQCPITKKTLRQMTLEEIANVNNLVDRHKLFTLDKESVNTKIDSGFISEDGRFAYPAIEGIAILLSNRALVLKDNEKVKITPQNNELKNSVQSFYNEIGWKQDTDEQEDGVYVDAAVFEDLRPVSQDYIHKCHLRINKYFKLNNQYILDVASGPVHLPEYVSYSDNFQQRICVDFSFQALREAQKQLKDRGIYILGDITNLPLQPNVVDSAISLHTIYHVPKNEQAQALKELHRVLKPNSLGIIVYHWGKHSLLMNVTTLPLKVVDKIRKRWTAFWAKGKKKSAAIASSELYFHTHSYGWFKQQAQNLNIKLDISIWRSVSLLFLQTYIHQWIFGKQILELIYSLEESFPKLAARFGQYPILIIQK
jgi:ubiquinone/menaquinone biosynthesis C-methylase UbiE/uncharacterized protein YbaR (Trm112 family)